MLVVCCRQALNLEVTTLSSPQLDSELAMANIQGQIQVGPSHQVRSKFAFTVPPCVCVCAVAAAVISWASLVVVCVFISCVWTHPPLLTDWPDISPVWSVVPSCQNLMKYYTEQWILHMLYCRIGILYSFILIVIFLKILKSSCYFYRAAWNADAV